MQKAMDETCIKWQSRVVDTDAVAVANTDTLFTWYMIWLCWQSWAHVWLSPLFALWSKKNRKLKRQLALVRNKQTSVLFLMFSKQNWWWHQFAAFFFLYEYSFLLPMFLFIFSLSSGFKIDQYYIHDLLRWVCFFVRACILSSENALRITK